MARKDELYTVTITGGLASGPFTPYQYLTQQGPSGGVGGNYNVGGPYRGQNPFQGPFPAPAPVPQAPPRGGGGGARGGGSDTPIGEPPPSEPGYEAYDPTLFEPESGWLKFWKFAAVGMRVLGDAFNLLTYSPDAGLSPQDEAARVALGLVYPAEPWLTGLFPTYAQYVANPYNNPDYQPDQYAEPEPVYQPIWLPTPNAPGLPLAAPDTEIIVVGRPAPTPATAPLNLVSPLAGLFPLGMPGALAAARPIAAPRAVTSPRYATPIANPLARPNFATGFGTLPLPNSLPLPQPGEKGAPASPDDCSCAPEKGKKNDKKKKRKKRDVCYRGVYYERADGLTKYRRERITCR